MSHYQKKYYHGYYKTQKKRANLVLSPDEYAAFAERAQLANQSVNQWIREKALEYLQGVRPLPQPWLDWMNTIRRDLYQLGNEVHQLSRMYLESHPQRSQEIRSLLEALFKHLQRLESQWREIQPEQ